MLEETLDPRPSPERFADALARLALRSSQHPDDLAAWLHGWHDREGPWTHLRNLEHWIGRAATP
jgi:hypothetical protein